MCSDPDAGEVVTGHEAADATIRLCFAELSAANVMKFRRRFREHARDEEQTRHTLRELMVGAFLARKGLVVEHERSIGTKSPDWSVLGSNGETATIIELVNFHTDRDRETRIRANLRPGSMFMIWGNDVTVRLYQKLEDKTVKYMSEAVALDVPYVVAVYVDFLAVVRHENIRACLMEGDDPLFPRFPHLSGVLYGVDGGPFEFHYIQNPHASRPVELPQGTF